LDGGVKRLPGLRVVALLVALLALSGCVTLGVKTTGAASDEDLGAENAYIALYMDHMTRVAADIKVFAPSGSNPGPCNKGGNAQNCFEADVQAIATMGAMLDALKAAKVPPRFVEADRLLKEALAKNIQGLELRNQALSAGDDYLWAQHGPLIEEAGATWKAAYEAFPEDHRPTLGP
jgi:hypothetical protein